MSHHYSGPQLGFPHGDARLDMTDMYAFPKPDDFSMSTLILNVHPDLTADQEKPTRPDPFAAEASYEIMIGTDGSAATDICYRVRFSRFVNGTQAAMLFYVEHVDTPNERTHLILDSAPVSMDRDPIITEANNHRFFAGWRSDPFFFDTLGALNGLKFTGHDFFLAKDICSIVIEAPSAQLRGRKVSLWARTVDCTNGHRIQADRGAKPTQSIFLTGDAREAYLAAKPADDHNFVGVFAHALEHSGGYSPVEAERAARTLLPDIMLFEPAQPASYPVSGRTLTDDVVDQFLPILTNGKVLTDGVGPHSDLLSEFPYLGPPHMSAAKRFASTRKLQHRL